MNRPVLIGMNSPQSVDPVDALRPWDSRSAGGRLLAMLQESATRREVSVPTAEDYMRVFDRRNLIDSLTWDARAARARGGSVIESLPDESEVVFCGTEVCKCLRLKREPWGVVTTYTWLPELRIRYCTIPHPSGLNHIYNDPAMREYVGSLLFLLYDRYVSSSP